MQFAGVVLCGGQSSRMGWPKALLPFGPEQMLQRVVRILGEVVSPIIVVAAPQQELPPLPVDVLVARDRDQGRGPLEGLRAGLAALASHKAATVGRAGATSGRGFMGKVGLADSSYPDIDAAYVTSCDVPLLVPAFVGRMIELFQAGEFDIAVPEADGFRHPLAAVYRLDVLPAIERHLAENRLRPMFLFDEVRTRVVAADKLLDVDPHLSSLRNLNHPADYLAALAAAGFSAPPEVLARLSTSPS